MPFFRSDGDLHYFAHVPKCGGSSVEAHLTQRFGTLSFFDPDFLSHDRANAWSRSSPQHITWRDLTRIVPESWIGEVFTVVRHPLSRLVSEFNFQRLYTRCVWNLPEELGILSWFEAHIRGRSGDRFDYDNHLRPQSEFFPERAKIFRLEDGLSRIGDWLDGQFGPSAFRLDDTEKQLESARRGGPRISEVPEALVRRVQQVYAQDFERLGYGPRPEKMPVIYASPPPNHWGAAWVRKRDLMLWRLRLWIGMAPRRPELGR